MIVFIIFSLAWIIITTLSIIEREHEKEEMMKQKVELETMIEDLQKDRIDLKNTVLKLQEEVQSLEKDKQELLDVKVEQEELLKERVAASDKVVSPTRGNGSRTKTFTFTATAYDLSFASCGKEPSHPQYGITASGVDLKGKSLEDKFIAVDPKIIKLGSLVHIEFFEPYQHLTGDYTAVDTGGAIKGKKVDIFHGGQNVSEKVREFGRREVKITY